MPFCKFCGNQIEDGEVCTCAEAVEEAKKAAEAVSAKAEGAAEKISEAAKPAEAPAPAYSDSMSHNAGASAPDAPAKKGIGMLAAAAVAVLLILFLLVKLFSGSGYQTPLKKLTKGVNKCDTELIMSAILTDDQIDEAKDDAEDEDIDWKDMIKDMDDLLEDATEVLEDEYFGKHMKVSYKITDKEKADKKALRKIEKEYDDDQKVKKAYKLKVELTVEGKDEEVTSKLTVYSVKLSDGWVLYADDGALSSLAEDFDEPIEAAGSKLTKLITKAFSEMGLGGMSGMGLGLGF